MFLGESELNGTSTRILSRFLDRLCQGSGSAEVGADSCLQLRPAPWKVRPAVNGFLHPAVNRIPIRSPEHGAAAKEGERVVFCSSIIDRDIPQHVFANLLGKIDVDPEEVGICLGRLDLLKQGLEPTERGSIPADPEKLDTLQRTNAALLLPVPDVFQDRREGGDTDTSANEYGNLTTGKLLGRGTIRTVDPDNR